MLTQEFFDRNTLIVAEELIGKYLVKIVDGKPIAHRITEVEAYDGPDDLASHARAGLTARTKIMYGKAGIIYVYFVYGMHNMLNIVTGPKGYPAAILIRGVESISGPGKVAKALNITRDHNGMRLSKESGLWIEERENKISKRKIQKTPRIGINYAGDIWKNKLYRFVLNEEK